MKFSIITPCYNAEKFIEDTIKSIIFQKGDFSIEYFVIDGGSNDRTVKIAEYYKNGIEDKSISIKCNSVDMTVISEPDFGMYDAVTKGFEKVSGDVIAYLNADDMYHRHAFKSITDFFSLFPKIYWITGMFSSYNKDGLIYGTELSYFFYNTFIRKGIHDGLRLNFIQQESTFFRRELLQLIDLEYFRKLKFAGDYYLWYKFAEKYPLFIMKALLSGFRNHNENTSKNRDLYYMEMFSFIEDWKLTADEEEYYEFLKEAWDLSFKTKSKNNSRLIYWDHTDETWKADKPIYLGYDLNYKVEKEKL